MDIESSLAPNDPTSAKFSHLLVANRDCTEIKDSRHPANQLPSLLEEIESRQNSKVTDDRKDNEEQAQEKEDKKNELKCMECHQSDVLEKYGHKHKGQRLESYVQCQACADAKKNKRVEETCDLVIGPLKKGKIGPWTNHDDIEQIPQSIIERYRLTVKEIKQLSPFANYSPGQPSKVGVQKKKKDFLFNSIY